MVIRVNQPARPYGEFHMQAMEAKVTPKVKAAKAADDAPAMEQ